MLKAPIDRSDSQLPLPRQTSLAASGETGLSWSVGPRALKVGFPSLPGVLGVTEGLPSTQGTDFHFCPPDMPWGPAQFQPLTA